MEYQKKGGIYSHAAHARCASKVNEFTGQLRARLKSVGNGAHTCHAKFWVIFRAVVMM